MTLNLIATIVGILAGIVTILTLIYEVWKNWPDIQYRLSNDTSKNLSQSKDFPKKTSGLSSREKPRATFVQINLSLFIKFRDAMKFVVEFSIYAITRWTVGVILGFITGLIVITVILSEEAGLTIGTARIMSAFIFLGSLIGGIVGDESIVRDWDAFHNYNFHPPLIPRIAISSFGVLVGILISAFLHYLLLSFFNAAFPPA